MPEGVEHVVSVQRAVLAGRAVELEEQRRLVLRGYHDTQGVKYPTLITPRGSNIPHQTLASEPESTHTKSAPTLAVLLLM